MSLTKKDIEKKYNVILERGWYGEDLKYPCWMAFTNDDKEDEVGYEDSLEGMDYMLSIFNNSTK